MRIPRKLRLRGVMCVVPKEQEGLRLNLFFFVEQGNADKLNVEAPIR